MSRTPAAARTRPVNRNRLGASPNVDPEYDRMRTRMLSMPVDEIVALVLATMGAAAQALEVHPDTGAGTEGAASHILDASDDLARAVVPGAASNPYWQ